MEANNEHPTDSGEPSAKRLRSEHEKEAPLHDEMFESFGEKDVGVTEYANSALGFDGLVKQRYSDFIVNEVDSHGRVVRLSDLSVPKELQTPKAPKHTYQLTQENIDTLLQKVGSEISEKITEFVKSTIPEDRQKASMEFLFEGDKTQRTELHLAFKSIPFLSTETSKSKDGQTTIMVKFMSAGQGRGQRGFRGDDWPSGRGQFLKFALYKENKDMQDALLTLSRFAGSVPVSRFDFAGNKDKRGITVQEITGYRVLPDKLVSLNEHVRGMRVGDFSFVDKGFQLGDLYGNRFSVVMRHVDGTTEQLGDACESLNRSGFINYYGLQRFGTGSSRTHDIGRCILKSEWDRAIDMIIAPRKSGDEASKRAYEHYKLTKNAEQAMNMYPRYMKIERSIMKGLAQYGGRGNLVAVLNLLPRTLRLMYVHAYQSFVWNTVVSERIKTHGYSPIIGDLVPVGDKVLLDTEVDADLDATLSTNATGEDNGDEDVQETAQTSANLEDMVRPLSESDIQESRYSVFDVVMPLPGYQVRLPANSIGDRYHEILSQDGLTLPKLRHNIKNYALKGSYRHIMVKPQDFMWKTFQYADDEHVLTYTDLDRLQGKPEPTSQEGGSLNALRLDFTLPSSSYATMLIRELCKRSTSLSAQVSMAKAAVANQKTE
eukprot:TRINITY_DN5579_c0_g1_i1.p1 TRINITY_DN5579_c0_g1~~TRINITY_DN5579_c0_g1_i1.p1  ORF type:complete len:658 (+),score=154.66 TRINITY_DN5579_c0_g1_i1:46-2019(+)